MFAAVGDGSRDSKENCRACWCGVEGTELEWAWPCADDATAAVERFGTVLEGSVACCCLGGILGGASLDVITERFLSWA